MYSPTLVQIKGFDAYGSPKIVGMFLPTPVVEALVHYFSVLKEPNRRSDSTSDHESELRSSNTLESAVTHPSPLTDRMAASFSDSDQHVLRHTVTQYITSPSENRQEEVYHVAEGIELSKKSPYRGHYCS